MKRQQRQFVVEVKTSRGRQLTRPKSIWGDTNLKAFAAEFDNDKKQIVELTNPTLDADVDHRKDSAGLASEIQVVEERQEPYPTIPNVVDLESNPTPQAQGELCHGIPAVISPQRASKAAGRAEEKRPETPRVERNIARHTRESVGLGDADQLAELEAENRRLKTLLRERLIADNCLLRERLARFRTEDEIRDCPKYHAKGE